LPHIPQLLASFWVSAQPVGQQVWVIEQAGPPLHIMGATHMLFTQVSPAGQAMPQLPQFLGSVLVSEHPVMQHLVLPVQAGPPLHVGWHMLFAQMSPVGHFLLQAPQLLTSVVVSVQPEVQHA
jgi:hypothetical protein